jgi:hypothetical protein
MKVALLAGALLLASAVSAQTYTVNVGVANRNCGVTGYACRAPIVTEDGTPDGYIEVYPHTGNLMRFDVDGALVWASTNYDGTNFTANNGAISGTLSYTISSFRRCEGGSGRGGFHGCVTYYYVASGTLTVTQQ